MSRFIRLVLVLGLLTWYFWNRGENGVPLSTPAKPLFAQVERPVATTPVRSGLPRPRPLSQTEVISDVPTEPRPLSNQSQGKVDWRSIPLLTAFGPSKVWNNWLCADVAGSPARSLWRMQDAPDDSIEIYEGSCEDWHRKGPSVN